jgi:predicted secreted protein
MSTPLAVAVYFTMWWIVLFAVLPFGVKSQHEAGAADLPAGADAGAPVAPMLWCKALWTTIISAVLFAALDGYMLWAG